MGDHESSKEGLIPAATAEKVVEDVLLPGFRFHPTDEELVAFYLKRKIQQRPLSIELIRQLDIYKYDPWDLPKLSTMGEKEWYFYCPRDRKYRNSARPNRVTRAGFWKATGTDRPIYSSQGGSKCIGLKKSLVFYKGRAAKGVKTDWMMHEFRLPTLEDSANKRFLEKNHISANDSWAICRIFKKTNPTAQRALSHSWVVSPTLTEDTLSHHDTPTQRAHHHHHQYHPQMGSSEGMLPYTTMQFCGDNGDKYLKQSSTSPTLSPLDFSPCKPRNHHLPISNIGDLFSPFLGVSGHGSAKAGTGAASADVPSLLSNMSPPLGLLGEFGKAFRGTGTMSADDVALLQETQDQNMKNQFSSTNANGLWGTLPFINGFPCSLPLNDTAVDYSSWKSDAVWDHVSLPQ